MAERKSILIILLSNIILEYLFSFFSLLSVIISFLVIKVFLSFSCFYFCVLMIKLINALNVYCVKLFIISYFTLFTFVKNLTLYNISFFLLNYFSLYIKFTSISKIIFNSIFNHRKFVAFVIKEHLKFKYT